MFRFLSRKSVSRRLVFSGALVIFVGFLLLSLPITQLATSQATISDHLFTAVSLVCVTGLSTQAVINTYNIFGQIICIILMQLGGLGLMSLIGFIIFKAGKQISLVDKLALQESLNREDATNFKHFLSTIFRYTFIIEAIGAGLFCIRFIPIMGWKYGIFTSIFMAVSSFCNAGFDNLGTSSLQLYADDILINLTVSMLIILGGIGFSVWFDIKRNYEYLKKSIKSKWHKPFYQRLSLHTRIVLLMTSILILFGTITTFILEYNNPATIGEFPIWQKVMASFFQAVTMRTAGFSTIDYSVARPATLLLFMMQMFIGGSPGGTAGGIKTTTFLVVILYLYNEVQNVRYTNFMNRTFPSHLTRRAMVIFIVFFLTFLTGLLGLSITDPEAPFLLLVFEVVSALGTVGVTANLTPTISQAGQIILMFLMFMGRIGPLTILLSLTEKKNKTKKTYKYAEASLLVG